VFRGVSIMQQNPNYFRLFGERDQSPSVFGLYHCANGSGDVRRVKHAEFYV
jgi:hypothetical protein